MLYYETINSETRHLLNSLQNLDYLKEMRLVGGTALALQIGHRMSIDIDLFGKLHAETLDLNAVLLETGKVQQLKETENIHIYLIDGIKVDIVNYHYPWIDDALNVEGILMASKKDIAAMKIAAITGRGSRKDFIDLYFLLKEFTLQEIVSFYLAKFPDGSEFMALKSLTYFDDAETDPMPNMLLPVSWKDVKEKISGIQKEY